MMKRVMAFLTMLMLALPFASVNAAGKAWYTYTPGEEVNFYQNKDDKVGVTTYVLSDAGRESQYVKTFVVGFQYKTSSPYQDTGVNTKDPTVFENTDAYTALLSEINRSETAKGFPYAKTLSEKGNLSLITLDELKTVFGATADGADKYTISVEKWGKAFELLVLSNGFFTQTVEDGKVWVVKFEKSEEKINKITVEKEDIKTASNYSLVPVVYFDKTYDCHERTVEDLYACYKCEDGYKWDAVGSDAVNSCDIVEDVTKEVDCTDVPKTGLEDYIVEFLAIATICGLALVIVKRKDLFKEV